MDCAKIGRDYGIPIISDGGTRTSGDATKALGWCFNCYGWKYVGWN